MDSTLTPLARLLQKTAYPTEVQILCRAPSEWLEAQRKKRNVYLTQQTSSNAESFIGPEKIPEKPQHRCSKKRGREGVRLLVTSLAYAIFINHSTLIVWPRTYRSAIHSVPFYTSWLPTFLWAIFSCYGAENKNRFRSELQVITKRSYSCCRWPQDRNKWNSWIRHLTTSRQHRELQILERKRWSWS